MFFNTISWNPTAAPPKPHARAPCGRSLLPLVGTGRRPSALRGPGARARARAKYTRKSRNLNFLLGQFYFRSRQKLFSFSSLATVQNQKLIRADFEKLWSIWSKNLKKCIPIHYLEQFAFENLVCVLGPIITDPKNKTTHTIWSIYKILSEHFNSLKI